jgi:hypothetical protein
METDVWLTPPSIIDALGPFDLDPAAAPEPRPWPTAKRHICLPADGLAADWGHDRVWLNPPFGKHARAWLAKLADHGHGTALTHARTETEWFIDTIWTRATAILFLYGRLHFHHADGTRAEANSGCPSVLVAYGEEDAHRLACSKLEGRFIHLDQTSA